MIVERESIRRLPAAAADAPAALHLPSGQQSAGTHIVARSHRAQGAALGLRIDAARAPTREIIRHEFGMRCRPSRRGPCSCPAARSTARASVVQIVKNLQMVGDKSDRHDHHVLRAGLVPVRPDGRRMSGSSHGWLGGPLRL